MAYNFQVDIILIFWSVGKLIIYHEAQKS